MMNRFTLISVGFHIAVVTVLAVGWPSFSKKDINEDQLVIIDMVDLAEVTNIASQSEGAPQDDLDQEKARPKPPPPPPPPAPDPEPAAEPAPAPKPDVASAEILPTDKKPEVAKPIARPVPRPTPPKKPKAEVKKPTPKPTPKPAPKPKPKPDLSKINELAKKSEQQKKRKEAATGVLQNLANIQKTKEAEKKQAQKVKKDAAKDKVATNLSNVVSKVTQKTDAKPSLTPIGVSELDRLRNHIAAQWNPPPAAAGADRLKVDIFVKLKPDGTVTEASIVEKARYQKDGTYRAAANAALRAVLDASPLPLPREKYELWKEFIFGFDPRFISR